MRTVLIWLLLALPALARVGGGESYAGGGSSYSSSSGGGGGDGIGLIIELLIRLIFYYPSIGIPLLIGVGIYFYIQHNKSQAGQAFRDLQKWSSSNTVQKKPRSNLSELKRNDPNFSETLFLDFVSSIYSRVQLGLGHNLGSVGAYLTPSMREQCEEPQSGNDAVIIGSIRVQGIYTGGEQERVIVLIEANLAVTDRADLYVVDEIVLTRKSGTTTPTPEKVYSLSCPSCGDNSAITEEGRCPSCDQIVNDGRWSWVLASMIRHKVVTKPPLVLSEGGEEIGTDLATVRSKTLAVDMAELQERDPEFSETKFKEFAKQTFVALQEAWTSMEWEKARPFETDYLFHQHEYWMKSYEKMGVRNVLEEINVTRVETARLSLDSYFDAITVRIFCTMKDYTIKKETGDVLVGSKTKPRHFSEYWTFVRRSGVTSMDRDAGRCPSCGAPLDNVNHVGDCQYCQTRITRGDFDWILARIEQDEAYG